MRKKLSEKSMKKQEVLIRLYNPYEDKEIITDVYPLLTDSSLRGMDLMHAEWLIEDFSYFVCFLLDITEPDIEYSVSEFPTETTIAQYSPQDYTVYINQNFAGNLLMKLYGIAGAIRHAWQEHTHPDWKLDYKERTETGLEEYNLQKTETDALAFAHVSMSLFFNAVPAFPMSDSLRDAVNKQIELVFEELVHANKIYHCK